MAVSNPLLSALNDTAPGLVPALIITCASLRVQRKSIGWLLGNAVIEKARSLGAKKVYLESNTILKPAISLYHKLGFNKVIGHSTPYERCNIQMERIISA